MDAIEGGGSDWTFRIQLATEERKGLVTRRQDSAKGKIRAEDLKKLLIGDRDLVKTIIEEALQQVLEAEMEEALQASKGERTAGRLGYRAGYYNRMLVTRVGHIELRVPQHRQGRFRRKSSSVISGVRKRWWRRCWRCTYKACPHAR